MGYIDIWAGSNYPGSGERRSSYQIIQHPVADMALIQLSQPFSLGGCIDAAPLPTYPIADGSECWITGWGRLYNNGPGATTLMQWDHCLRGHICIARLDLLLCALIRLAQKERR